MSTIFKLLFVASLGFLYIPLQGYSQQKNLVIQNRRELFVDNYLIENLKDMDFRLATPVSGGKVLDFTEPWEGRYALGGTIIKDDTLYRMYYRGWPFEGLNNSENSPSYLCYAESADGIVWTRPHLRQKEVSGTLNNNVLKSGFLTVLYDKREEVPIQERFKALSGNSKTGLYVMVSPDGFSWKRYSIDTTAVGVGKGYALDSPNVLTWVPSEKVYAIYMRGWTGDIKGKSFYHGVRTIMRSTSNDLVNWTEPKMMEFGGTPLEHLYTNSTAPYFRAPHILISMPMRYNPDSSSNVLSKAELIANDIHPMQRNGISDAVFMTSRGGNVYNRKFLESFVRPGLNQKNWAARSQIPALGLVPTGPNEMSFYVTRAYGSKPYLERLKLRIDGFASLSAGYLAGSTVTKPLTLDGDRFFINYSSSPIGYVKVLILDSQFKELKGFGENDAVLLRGDEIDAEVTWNSGRKISELSGKNVRIKFIVKDADVFSFGVFDEHYEME